MISHPNKNPDPESKKLFVKIATAYEVFYRAKYGHKSDPRAVLVGLLVVLSAFQYLNNVARYNEALATVKRTPAYKNRLKALELERTGGVASKKKGPKQIDQKLQQELSNELDLQIKGAEKPSVWDLLGVRFVLLPYTIIKLLVWYSSWVWRYKMHISRKIWYREGYGRSRTLRTTMQKCLKN
ncbi:Chaperone protein dnaJ 50 [Raphanus sativus]|nr:Chaperone protein dnaJ 50 [Raphanus sativus]